MAELSENMSDLAHHFLTEATSIQKGGPVAIDDLAVLPVLDAWASCLEWARTASLSDDETRGVAQAANEAAEAYEVYKQVHGQTKGTALTSVEAHLDVFLAVFTQQEKGGASPADFKDKRQRIANARREASVLAGVMVYVSDRTADLDRAIAGTKAAEQAANAAVVLAQKAATDAATSTLETSFQQTAKANNTAAWWFRGATLAVLASTVAVGGFFVIDHIPVESQPFDWYGVVYRLAVLSGLGAIAAYLGRQASNYSRLATWAHSISIQLKAFLGFVNEIQDEDARLAMFALFGKRVLESPPGSDGSADHLPANFIQPIFEQAAKMKPPT